VPFKSKESPTSLRCGSEAADSTDTMSCFAGEFKISNILARGGPDTPTRIWRITLTGGPHVDKSSKPQVSETDQKTTLLWSRDCQVSGEYGAVASESISCRGHGWLRRTWDRVPNDLLSVSRSLFQSRTPNAFCVTERSWQPGTERSYLLLGSACADHLGRITVASTRDNFRFDVACGRVLLSCFTWPRLTHIAWGEGGWGAGAGTLVLTRIFS